jgi:hypothetical protein
VEAIRLEVVELCSRSVSPARSAPSMVVSDVASSPTPLKQIPDLNSPPEAPGEEQEETSPEQCLICMLCFSFLVLGIFYRLYVRLLRSFELDSGTLVNQFDR